MSALSVSGLSVVQAGREVLHEVGFSVEPGEMVALLGPNGAGKTTALRAALGLVKARSGEATLGDVDVFRLDPRGRAERVGYLPQERRLAWGLPAIEVAALGAPLAPPQAARERAMAALELFHVGELADRSVFELSGGERARVLLARLFATEAPLLVADEPVAGLDPDAQLLCLERLRDHTRAGGAVLLTLHDLGLAARYADRVVVFDGGRVMADGPPGRALTQRLLREVFGIRAKWVVAADGERIPHLTRA
ncbi:ABC transporter ATP-binding protein [Brevundimonas sp.]|uniref:ABC transporter ATP-binding protein n=1 Tax=Brevundimonas sp. TaxID=1871086 RepID=UPI0025FCD8B5|nr:ABC transporter ATP-binding protein [Brevundimonas sp.]